MRHALTSLAVLLLPAAPALAQAPAPKPIEVAATAPWRHANSGMTLPPVVGGLTRTKLIENEAPELDVTATWERGDDVLTVYVYRSTAGSVPVWFDRATWAIEGRGLYGSITPAQAPAAIRAPGATTDAGLIASWTTQGRYRGTGVAILPLGEWLVKLRYSSPTQDGAAVAEVLRSAVAALGWPATIPAAPPAQPVAACADRLKFKGTAKNAPADMTTALLSAFGGMGAALASETRPTFCREGDGRDNIGVYRADPSTNSYFIALSDAGRGLHVGPSASAVFDKKAKPSWSVDLVLPGQTVNFAAQDRLPRPERALELLRTRPVSSATTFGSKREVNLPASR